jgi:exodeoxyribonuclease X
MPKKLLFLDTETTSKEGRMIQLAYKPSTENRCAVYFYKAPEPISIGAMATHHITNEMMEQYQPLEQESEHRSALVKLFNGVTVVAHNAPFDVAVLEREGFEIAPDSVIDTLQVAKHLLPGLESYSLQYLRYYFGCTFAEQINPHDAESDVIVLEAVFNRLALLVAEKYNFGPEEVAKDEPGLIEEKMIELSNSPVLLQTMPFGKHKGKKFDILMVQDRQYMNWLDDQNDLDKDLKHTLQYWLLGKYKIDENQPKLI